MRKLVRDESGMTMALAIMMIVLIGVMGAGLLTFVSTDLESVLEVNQGQRAQEMADVGVDAAKRHLAVQDAMPSSYDSVVTAGNSSWYDDSTPKVLSFGGEQVRVGIRYLTPSADSTQARQPDYAPAVLPSYFTPGGALDPCNDTNGDGVDDDLGLPSDVDACEYPNNRNYFRVTVRGDSGNARRQVQAIYVTQNFDFPVAYYATRDIDFNGDATNVDGISLFANRYVHELRPENITGVDQAYGNWAVDRNTGATNPYNGVPRTDSTGSSTGPQARAAGAAALGDGSASACVRDGPDYVTTSGSGITYAETAENRAQKSRTAGTAQKYGFRDYDKDSDYQCSGSSLVPSGRPDFRANTWSEAGSPQPSGTVTFPFPAGNVESDNELLDELKTKAQADGLYVRRPPGSDFTIGVDLPLYPEHSDLTETVMYVEFANADGSFTDALGATVEKGTVTYKATSTDSDNLVKGTIVVVNGDLRTSPSGRDDFQGVLIVRDPDDTDNGVESNVMTFDMGGSFNIEGFVNVEGDMSLGGSIDGFLPAPLINGVPGLFKVSLWSWRECYNTTCS